MLNTDMIREKYSMMLDSQLIAIAKKDAPGLMPEAFQILKQEFAKRNLDYSYIESAEENKTLIHQEKIQKVRDSNNEEFSKITLNYVLEEKQNGTPDSEILAGLQERGLDEEHSQLLLAGVENKLKEIIDAYDTKMLVGGISFFAGILVTIGTYSAAMASGKVYIVAWGAILFGMIRFFSGYSDKSKYKRILKNIQHTAE